MRTTAEQRAACRANVEFCPSFLGGPCDSCRRWINLLDDFAELQAEVERLKADKIEWADMLIHLKGRTAQVAVDGSAVGLVQHEIESALRSVAADRGGGVTRLTSRDSKRYTIEFPLRGGVAVTFRDLPHDLTGKEVDRLRAFLEALLIPQTQETDNER